MSTNPADPTPTDTTGTIPAPTLGERMAMSMREAGLKIGDIAEFLHVSKPTVGAWINDRRPPSAQTLMLWAQRCGVDYQWLAEGTTPDCHAGTDL